MIFFLLYSSLGYMFLLERFSPHSRQKSMVYKVKRSFIFLCLIVNHGAFLISKLISGPSLDEEQQHLPPSNLLNMTQLCAEV